jgi:hypothetical protein
MGKRLDLLTATTAFGVAAYVAIIMDCVACGQLGWSDGKIRSVALLVAACVALGLALDFLGRRWRRQPDDSAGGRR